MDLAFPANVRGGGEEGGGGISQKLFILQI